MDGLKRKAVWFTVMSAIRLICSLFCVAIFASSTLLFCFDCSSRQSVLSHPLLQTVTMADLNICQTSIFLRNVGVKYTEAVLLV